MSTSPHEPDCLFCKIARGESPASVVHQTDEAVAILDIHPVVKGHVLLIPKAHYRDLASLPEALAGHVGSWLPALCRAVVKATGAEGTNVVVNNGAAAGQTIAHGHWHVIPRFKGDPVRWPWPHDAYDGDEMGQMRFQIARELDQNLVED